jgi:hypothetical protein
LPGSIVPQLSVAVGVQLSIVAGKTKPVMLAICPTGAAPVGETLTVTLHVPVAESGALWQPITPSDTNILEPVSNGVVSLARGVTATFLAVRKGGVVTITSTRPSGTKWSATVAARPK